MAVMEWKASLTFMNRRAAEDFPLRSENICSD
jgi:hypothetical protein